MEVGGGEGGDAGEEDIVVDDQPLPPAQIVPAASSRNDNSAFNSSDKLLSLEQAILTSIDRCRKLLVFAVIFFTYMNTMRGIDEVHCLQYLLKIG